LTLCQGSSMVKKRKCETKYKKQRITRITSFTISNWCFLISFGHENLIWTKIDKPKTAIICSCNTWILLRSTTRSTFRQFMISVTMMQLKLSLHVAIKRDRYVVACASANILTCADVSCDSKSTRRDYVSPSFSPQICWRNSYVTTNFRINITLYNSYINYVAVAELVVKDNCSDEWR